MLISYIISIIRPWDKNKFIHHGCDLEENELVAIMNCVKPRHVDRNPKDRTFYQRGPYVFGHLGEHVALRFILQHKIP
jgi:hypothetical protein